MNEDHQKLLDHIDNMLMTRTNLAVDDVVALKIKVKDALEASEARAQHVEELLTAWFDRRKLAHERIDQAVYDATKSYLRRSANGGMDAGDVGMVLGIIEDMTRLSVFADLFARATVEQDWQPIATAPRNGESLEVGVWVECLDGSFVWSAWHTNGANDFGNVGFNGEEPTHWRYETAPPPKD